MSKQILRLADHPSVVRPTLLYINSEAVIPAKAEILMVHMILHLKPIFSNTE
jgi:hypothetical protein